MKTTVNEIIEYIYGINPIYNIPSFETLLKINSKGSFVTAFSQVINKALNEFELKVPLFMWDKRIAVTGTTYEFYDNYEAVLEGKVPEEYLELIPTSILHYSTGLLTQYRDMSYVAPKVRLNSGGRVTISYYAKYPRRLTKDQHEDKFTDDAHIYGISKLSGVEWTYLMYIIEFNLLNYIRDQKNQLTYTELPLDFLGSIEMRLSDLHSDITEWYNSGIWYGKLYM